jgi:glutathione S-transferase
MKLYVDPLATSCRLILALVEHEGLSPDIHLVSLAAGENRTEAFLAIQPSGKVPVLCDGDFVLTESLAIARYLLRGGYSALYPSDSQARARVDEFVDWVSTSLSPAFLVNWVYPTLMPKFRFEETNVNEAVSARARQTTLGSLAVLEQQLERSGPFVLGTKMTLGDLAASAVLCWAPVVALDLADFPHVEKWRAAMRSVPAWRSQEQVLETYLAAAA